MTLVIGVEKENYKLRRVWIRYDRRNCNHVDGRWSEANSLNASTNGLIAVHAAPMRSGGQWNFPLRRKSARTKQQISNIRLDPVNGGQEIECDGNYLSNYWRFGRDREWGGKKFFKESVWAESIGDGVAVLKIGFKIARCVTNWETFSRLKSSKHKAKSIKFQCQFSVSDRHICGAIAVWEKWQRFQCRLNQDSWVKSVF